MITERLAQIWPEWEVEKQLGKGSYGVVYQAVRRDNHIQSRAAIKVISIPIDASEIDSLRSEGLSIDGAKTYFQGIVDDFVGEIQIMNALKGVQNIVSVEDYKVVERTGEIGWDIYIRMELLTPFNSYVCDKQLTEAEVIKLGADICTALEVCAKRNIIHRDIKPENIFVNDFGYFKLGDFGVARKLENATGGLSQKGTFNYMAPEVATGTHYDARVDVYSLGVVLYRLLNQNRLPFIESEQQLLNPNERKNAVERRLRGEQMKPPCAASAQVAAAILRACAFNPENRFANATEMKEALQRASVGAYQVPEVDLDKTVSVRQAPVHADDTVYTSPVLEKAETAVPRYQKVSSNAQPEPTAQPMSGSNPEPAVRQVPDGTLVLTKVKKKRNMLCLMALVSSLLSFVIAGVLIENVSEEQEPLVWAMVILLCFVSLVLAVMGRRKTQLTNTKGNGFALSALVISNIMAIGAAENMYEGLITYHEIDETAGMLVELVVLGIFVRFVVAYCRIAITERKERKKAEVEHGS